METILDQTQVINVISEGHKFAFCYILGRVLRGDITITTINLSCLKIISAKLHSEYRIIWASLCASFALFSQKLREWQHLSAYFLNIPRMCYKEVCYKGTALYYRRYRPCSKEITTLVDKYIDGSTLFHKHNF